MSRPNPTNRRNHRVVQMCEQEEIILRKKREILERQQQQQTTTTTTTLASQHPVEEQARASVSPNGTPFKNTFSNDGSFLENFKKLTQAATFLEQQEEQQQPLPPPEERAAAVINGVESSAVVADIIPNTVQELVAMVVAAGDGGETVIEERLRSRKNDLPQQLWFLFDLNSTGYRSYRSQLESARRAVPSDLTVAGTSRPAEGGVHAAPAGDFAQFVNGQRRGACYREEDDDTEDSDTEYRREAKERNLKNMKNRLVCHYEDSDSSSSDQNEQPKYEGSRFNQENFPKLEKGPNVINDTAAGPSGSGGAAASAMNNSNKKKRKSRWDVDQVPAGMEGSSQTGEPPAEKKSRVDRSNPEVIKLAVTSFGSAHLDEDQWVKVEQQFQVKQVYNEMLAKRAERERLEQSGRFKFEYDSDEDVDGGTWEHKLRKAEMESTRSRTDTLTTSGRHHIGDFLPPDELKKFMEQHDKRKRKDGEPATDYQDKKLTEENKGFQMLQKLGWKDGEGLGASGSGIVNPINKSATRESNQGLGVSSACSPEEDDNEYDAYRKRMMLAYRFRPNPMNNPRRAYY